MLQEYDLCIIGAGPAGFAAAMRAWDFGKKVCLIEKGRLGGTGVTNGALSSKTLWELSRDYRRARVTNRGYTCEKIRVDYDQVMHCMSTACNERITQMNYQLEVLRNSCEEWEGSIHHLHGSASFIDSHHVEVESPDPQKSCIIKADYFLIATGSHPRILPEIPVDGHHIMTSDHLMNLKEFPRSLVILGAGVVGCEFATIFANFGETKVNLIDRADRILPFEDPDISHICTRNLEARGVTVHQRARLISMEVVDGMVEYTIAHCTGGYETLRVERALISVGRIPNTEHLGLENAGIDLSDRGHIIDRDTHTSSSHIFAAGDVTYDVALVNVAEIEGRHAVECMFGGKCTPLSYENLSSIMFLDPEVGAVGMNELQAQKQRIPYRVATYGYRLSSRAIAMRSTKGFIKILATDPEEGEDMYVLGMRVLGAHASTALESVSMMIRHNLPVQALSELWHPHPAITEALQECMRMLQGTSVFKPQVFPTDLRLSRITYPPLEEES